MARAMLAPVMGSPASSSQNMIWRYSSSATVTAWLDTLPMVVGGLTPLDERRDDGLVEAVAHRGLRHGGVGEARERLAHRGIAGRAVGHGEEPAHGCRAVEVLERVADRDALLRRVVTRAEVEGDALRLARPARDEVVGVGDLDPFDRRGDGPVVEEAQVVVAGLGENVVRLADVDTASEEVGQHPVGMPGPVPLEPP